MNAWLHLVGSTDEDMAHFACKWPHLAYRLLHLLLSFLRTVSDCQGLETKYGLAVKRTTLENTEDVTVEVLSASKYLHDMHSRFLHKPWRPLRRISDGIWRYSRTSVSLRLARNISFTT